ncbi:hypothetical protein [Rhodopseudomonas parapalustris]
MQTMSFAQFFSPELEQFNTNIENANKIMNEIQNQINHNQEILKQTNPLQDFIQRGQYHAPQNTPQNAILTSDYWAQLAADAVKKTIWLLWCSFVDISRTISFMGCIIGIMLWAFGVSKGKAITIGSLLFYIIIKIINVAFGG